MVSVPVFNMVAARTESVNVVRQMIVLLHMNLF